MPLAGAIAINFSAPLFAALVSIVWLKERVGFARWCALLIGFFGVLIVTNPGEIAHPRRVVRAGQCDHVRQRHRRSPRHDQDRIGQYAGDLAVGAPWRSSTVSCCCSAGDSHADRCRDADRWRVHQCDGQYFWTHALRLAPTTAVSPFYYLMLVWAMVIGFLFGATSLDRPAYRIGYRHCVRAFPAVARARLQHAVTPARWSGKTARLDRLRTA